MTILRLLSVLPSGPACETFLKRAATGACVLGPLMLALVFASPVPGQAQAAPSATSPPAAPVTPPADHGRQAPAAPAHAGDPGAPASVPAAQPVEAPGHAAPAHAPAAAAQGHDAEAGHGAAAPHAESPWKLVARLLNFALLVGGLVYLLRGPLSQHLATRTQQIRGDLVAARETTARATAQIDELDRKLAALPAELEALRVQGVDEIAAEEARIRQQAETDRQRLLDQTRREVDLQVRLARRALASHAADLAVALAKDRITATINDDDQAHLADRYVAQVKDLHG